MYKSIIYILTSIVFGFISAIAMGDGDDSETIILAAIFWLLASIHYRLNQKNY